MVQKNAYFLARHDLGILFCRVLLFRIFGGLNEFALLPKYAKSIHCANAMLLFHRQNRYPIRGR